MECQGYLNRPEAAWNAGVTSAGHGMPGLPQQAMECRGYLSRPWNAGVTSAGHGMPGLPQQAMECRGYLSR
ncbi:hypothetical protein ACOMHN_009570 [Nucella lapillus]